ncbi:MAG: hypothetical protein LBH25_15425 [Fibromonadaceae bacterium]|jgi:uncharacterized protein (TIGR02145 family)|nr:hypothetical protein [Fibromonadaceae bacterium]
MGCIAESGDCTSVEELPVVGDTFTSVKNFPVYVNESGAIIKIIAVNSNTVYEKFIAIDDTLHSFSYYKENTDEWYSDLASRMELHFLDDSEKCLIFDGPIEHYEFDIRSFKSYEKGNEIENWSIPYRYHAGVEYIYTITPELRAMAKEGNCSPSCNNAITNNGTVTCGNQTYKTVKIGDQTWMAENLNYDANYYYANGSVCYDNSESNCTIYGRLYNWNTALKVCPEGWHLPSDAEWTALTNYIESDSGCSDCAGIKLKTNNGWHNNGNGTDDYGFSALPGGYTDGQFHNFVGYYGFWWSSSENESENNYAYIRFMYYNYSQVSETHAAKRIWHSVRCVQTASDLGNTAN